MEFPLDYDGGVADCIIRRLAWDPYGPLVYARYVSISSAILWNL